MATTVRFNQLGSKGNGNWACSHATNNNYLETTLNETQRDVIYIREGACGRIKVEHV